jgi:inorganic pyrophosphatase
MADRKPLVRYSAMKARSLAACSAELEDKTLKIIGWKGPKAAVQAIKDAAKSFAKDDK